VFALQHARSAGFLTIPAAIAVAALLDALRRNQAVASRSYGRLSWSGVSVGIFGGLALVGSAVAGDSEVGSAYDGDVRCPLKEITPILAEHDTTVVATTIWYGPEVLYRTDHGILAGPYHRNAQGIVDLHRFFVARPGESLAIAEERSIGLILLCPSGMEYEFAAEEAGPESLDAALRAGDLPAWISPVALPEELDDRFMLFEVVPSP
jgi:hypothetical protein